MADNGVVTDAYLLFSFCFLSSRLSAILSVFEMLVEKYLRFY